MVVDVRGGTKEEEMKRVLRIAAVLCVLIVAGATIGQENFEVNIYYFADRDMTIETGDFYNYCDGSFYGTGIVDNYRIREIYNCVTQGATHVCQEKINGVWTDYTCPYPY